MGLRRWILLAAAVLLAACGLSVVGKSDGTSGVDPRSDGAPPGEVPPGGDDSSVGFDAGSDAAFVCPAACTSCDTGTCNIDCIGGTQCAKVVCPPGIPCKVTCVGEDACTKGVDCTQASSCNITCDTGGASDPPGACHDVLCSGGSCTLTCTGEKACQKQIACDAGACSVTCGTEKACCTKPICNGCGVNGPGDGVGGC